MSKHNLPLPDPNTDPYTFVGLYINPDGSFFRLPETLPTSPPSPEYDPANPIPVLSQDFTINAATNTWARLYLPRHESGGVPAKLPLIVYYKGGGFVRFTADTAQIHNFVSAVAAAVPAAVVSVDYRLAPEHRLPAAYDDGVEALRWLRSGGVGDWFNGRVDFTNCYLMGSSAGGNAAYNVGLRAISAAGDGKDDDLLPMRVRGLILHQPFFGGESRTSSEIRGAGDAVLPPLVTDAMWVLALPVGADRDHEYCNPTVGMRSGVVERIRDEGWRVLVTGCDGDPLVDRQIELVKMMKEKGIDVKGEFSEGGHHGVEIWNESRAKVFYEVVRNFVLSL